MRGSFGAPREPRIALHHMTEKADTHREGTDEALVVRYQRGDRAALSVLVRRHARTVYSAAFYIAGSEDIASTLAFDVYKLVMEHAGSFHIEMHFRTWLFRFLHQRIHALFVTPAEENLANETTANGTEPSSANALPRLGRSQLLNRRVLECVGTLPHLIREAIVLKLVGQLTIPELALATDSDEDSVRDLLRQALCRIRDAISDTEDYARALR
jgi:RNA polymerase sigma-70 factor (ECF subfamily)